MSTMNRLFWRVHFWSGLVTAPIVLFAACTGLLYVVAPQVEAWRHAGLDRVPAGTTVQPLDAQVAAVQAGFPDRELRYVVPSHAPGSTTQVYLRAPHAHHQPGGGEHDHGLPSGSIVYVDPGTAKVVGALAEMQRFKTWAKRLHSSALQGDAWRWVMELGASWMMVMFATGLSMWWPRPQATGGPGWRALVPRFGRGRQTWRDLHAVVALMLGLVLAIVLVTGLTWAKYSGANFRMVQDALGQGSPKVPKDLHSVLPSPGASSSRLSWQAVYERARAGAPDVSMQITPPRGAGGVWRVENFDRSQPDKRFMRVFDAYSGRTLIAGDWEQLPLLAKATAIGIPFHRGEFGVWNQVVLGVAALGAIFSVISGVMMWWLRRPSGRVAAPSFDRQHLRGVPLWVGALALGLAAALPVFGCSLLLLVVLESVRLAWPQRGRAWTTRWRG